MHESNLAENQRTGRTLPGIDTTVNGTALIDENKVTALPITVAPVTFINADVSIEKSTTNHNSMLPVVCGSSKIPAPSAPGLINGYLSDPPPLIPQGTVLPRPILNSRPFKNAQPTHTGPGMIKNVVNMPGFEHHLPQAVGKATNLLPQGLHCIPHHSFISQSAVTTASSNPNLILPGPGNHQTNNNNIVPQQSGNHHIPVISSDGTQITNFHAYPQMMMRPPNHSANLPPPRNILTSIATSSSIMTTTQSHAVGPPLSHSPSPVGVPNEQMPLYPPGSEALDPRVLDRANNGTPPSQPPLNVINKPVATTNTNGTNTPSPPLIQPLPANAQSNKHHNCLNCESGTSSGSLGQMYFHHQMPPYLYPMMTGAHNPNNGLVTPIPPFFQQAHASYPNGMSPELQYMAAAHARYPQQINQNPVPQQFLYGNNYPTHNQVAMPHPPHSANSGPIHVNGLGSKIACYNCGNAGHKATECKEVTMDSMASKYILKLLSQQKKYSKLKAH